MFDHRSYATEGLFPGLVTTRSIANLGAFIFEVIIEPVLGGAGRSPIARPRYEKDKYKITIRVRHKDRVWSIESIVGKLTAQIAARLLRTKLIEPEVAVTSVAVAESVEPTIEVFKK